MDNWQLTPIEAAARRYCDRHEITDYADFQRVAHGMRYEAFRREIEPFILQKVRIESLRITDYIPLRPDGSFGDIVRKPLPDSLEQALRMWDEQIILSAQRWGLASSPVTVSEP